MSLARPKRRAISTGGKMKVALYCRVSTEEQAIHGLSLDDQITSLRAYAAQEGHVVAGEYVDPGVSARKRYTKRPGLMRLLEDAKKGRFDMVLFVRIDRWVRSVRDYYEIQGVLDDAGVTWKATREDYEIVTASGRLKVNIMLSVAQDEADRTGERVRSIIESKKQKGLRWGASAPLGLRVVNQRLEPDPEYFDLAVEAFQQLIAFRSIAAVRRWMADQGVTRHYNNIRNMLSNKSYVPYIGEETFRLTQHIIQQRAQRNAGRSTNHLFLFSGLLVCGSCGHKLSGSYEKRSGREYYYYKCNTAALGVEPCSSRTRVNEKTIEKYLIENLEPLIDQYNAGIEKRRKKKSLPDPEKINRKLEKLKDLYLNDFIDRATYVADVESLRDQLEKARQEEEKHPIDLSAIHTAMSLYDELSRAGKKEFWSRIIEKIQIINPKTFRVSFL